MFRLPKSERLRKSRGAPIKIILSTYLSWHDSVSLWLVANPIQLVASIQSAVGRMSAVAFSPNGKLIAGGTYQSRQGTADEVMKKHYAS